MDLVHPINRARNEIAKFMVNRPGISLYVVESEANLPAKTIISYIAGKGDMLQRQIDSLKPILIKYGLTMNSCRALSQDTQYFDPIEVLKSIESIIGVTLEEINGNDYKNEKREEARQLFCFFCNGKISQEEIGEIIKRKRRTIYMYQKEFYSKLRECDQRSRELYDMLQRKLI